jgi:hypothetical protein
MVLHFYSVPSTAKFGFTYLRVLICVNTKTFDGLRTETNTADVSAVMASETSILASKLSLPCIFTANAMKYLLCLIKELTT